MKCFARERKDWNKSDDKVNLRRQTINDAIKASSELLQKGPQRTETACTRLIEHMG